MHLLAGMLSRDSRIRPAARAQGQTSDEGSKRKEKWARHDWRLSRAPAFTCPSSPTRTIHSGVGGYRHGPSRERDALNEQLFPALTAEVPNFRDLGGVPAGPGREFRRGVVYRTQALTGLSEQAQSELVKLGLTCVVDLRMASERVDLPVTVPDGIAVQVADVVGSAPTSAAAAAGAAATGHDSAPSSPASPAGGKDMMLETYRNFVRSPAAQAAYGAFARTVATEEGSIAVYCAAGKDRTGWAAAFLQNLAGVDESTAIDEYAKSNANLVTRYQPRMEKVLESGGDVEAFRALVNADPDYLAEAFAFMRAEFGDIEGYASRALGLSPDELALLRDRIVEAL